MKKIITHISPHLDEILAIYFIKKFDKDWTSCEVSFKATNPQGGEVDLDQVDKDPDTIYLGLGRGKYDEHALGKEAASKVAAASLVWEDFKGRGLTPQSGPELRAMERLLDFVVQDDLGKLKDVENYLIDFSITALWDGFSQYHRGDSDKKLEYGLPLMDYMAMYLTNIATAEEVVANGDKFDTPWGPGVAVSTEFKTVAPVAYRSGFVLVVNINPKLGYRAILGKASSVVDLTEAYEKATSEDPAADWYLHQSKRMLISGSHSAPNVKVSTLPMEKMIELVKG